MAYFTIIEESYWGMGQFILNEIRFKTEFWYENYFWMLILFSAIIYALELIFPWRKEQKRLRKDFFLDLFYLFFNFYLFKLIFFAPFSAVIRTIFEELFFIKPVLSAFPVPATPLILHIILLFVTLDLVQWLVHRLLHRSEFLWEFHKVHHSVEEMGFAAHLRFHWMEHICYTPVKYLTLLLLGGEEPNHIFFAYALATMIGHLNHANINIHYGFLRFIFNSPHMHIWHHAKNLPKKYWKGCNFGISLSIWDYLFKTAYEPKSGKDISLGFPKIEEYPQTFWRQMRAPFQAIFKQKIENID